MDVLHTWPGQGTGRLWDRAGGVRVFEDDPLQRLAEEQRRAAVEGEALQPGLSETRNFGAGDVLEYAGRMVTPAPDFEIPSANYLG